MIFFTKRRDCYYFQRGVQVNQLLLFFREYQMNWDGINISKVFLWESLEIWFPIFGQKMMIMYLMNLYFATYAPVFGFV